ncbi:hypothetical protein [Sphingobacterium multivorum]|uniref:hypothetical protein n=1 Tax=Sphingobacterium multivorum TaxID=28454 RepID=UPI002899B6AA|nr:hypothetical protein [Sphingobacterium multivorum]
MQEDFKGNIFKKFEKTSKQELEIEFDSEGTLKRKEEAITELYLTGRYKGLYMGRESSCKDNPIKVYVSNWMKLKGWNEQKIDSEIDDYYNELFTEFCKIKLHKWPELLDNPRKMTATICLMAQRHLFRDVNEKYPKAKSYYEKNKLFSTALDREMQRINHIEFLEMDNEHIIDDDQETGFEKKYKIDVDGFMALMTEEQRQLFYNYINKKGTGQKGRFNNADRAKYNEILEQVTKDCKEILKRINS